MPRGEEALRERITTLYTEESDYARDWVQESLFWFQNGIYSRVAAQIPELARAKLHLDLGCGIGLLPLTIADKARQASVVGIDRNPHMLPWAKGVHRDYCQMTGSDLPLQIYHGEVAGMSESGEFSTTFVPAEAIEAYQNSRTHSLLPDVPHTAMLCDASLAEDGDYPYADPDFDRPGLTLVADDLNDLRLTEHYLGDRRADSVSMMFFGASGRAMVEGGRNLKRTQAGREAHYDSVRRADAAAMNFATEVLAPGGSLVLVDRVPVHLADRSDVVKIANDTTVNRMGDCIDAYRGDVSLAIFREVFKNPTLGKIVWGATPNGTPIDKAKVAVTVLRKKD